MTSTPQCPDERIIGDIKETMLSSAVAMVTCDYYITSFMTSCRRWPHGREENMSYCPLLFYHIFFFFYTRVCIRERVLVLSRGDSSSIRKVGSGLVSRRHSALPQRHTWKALYACCLCVCVYVWPKHLSFQSGFERNTSWGLQQHPVLHLRWCGNTACFTVAGWHHNIQSNCGCMDHWYSWFDLFVFLPIGQGDRSPMVLKMVLHKLTGQQVSSCICDLWKFHLWPIQLVLINAWSMKLIVINMSRSSIFIV